MNNLAQKQNEVKAYLDNKPCDSETSSMDPGAKEYYLEIEQERYNHQSHILEILSKIDWRTKRVLEVGTGVGTDARKIIKYGADYTGVNIDQGSAKATAKAFDVFRLKGKVIECSATELCFEDECFDIVYSFGVLHHIPEVGKSVSEIYRILKPGGELIIMLYNRASINYYIEIMFLRKIILRLLSLPGIVDLFRFLGLPKEKLQRHIEIYRASHSMDNKEWLSRNTDGPDNPYSCVYGKKEVEELFHDFKVESNTVYFFDYRHWGFLGKMLPRRVVNLLGRYWGWHRVVYAVKPT